MSLCVNAILYTPCCVRCLISKGSLNGKIGDGGYGLPLSETPHAEREALEGPLEGGSRDKGFSEVTGGRASSFRGLSVREASRPGAGPGSLGTKE